MIGPDGVDYVTTAEACERLGPDINPALIRDWARRKLIHPAGRHPGRAMIYRWVEVVEAEKSTRLERVGRPRSLPEIDSECTMDPISHLVSVVEAAQKQP